MVVTAGFWNSHVHILTPGLLRAEGLSSKQITSQLQEMLTRWGFTTVFDIASVLQNTTLIRRRIESGEVKGLRILTVGEPFWGKGGTPIYIRGFLVANHISISDVESSAQAKEWVRQQIRDGADGIKIFANSIERDGIVTMPLDLATAIVAEAHQAGKPVFAQRLTAVHMALTPTSPTAARRKYLRMQPPPPAPRLHLAARTVLTRFVRIRRFLNSRYATRFGIPGPLRSPFLQVGVPLVGPGTLSSLQNPQTWQMQSRDPFLPTASSP
jgi:hypothetical protein